MTDSVQNQKTVSLDNTLAEQNVSRTIGLTVLFHPNTDRIGEIASLIDLGSNTVTKISRTEPIFRKTDWTITGALMSPSISRTPIEIQGTVRDTARISASSSKTRVVVNGKVLKSSVEFSREDLSRGVVLELAKSVVLLLHLLDAKPSQDTEPQELVGDSTQIRLLRTTIKRVADLEVPVLLHGETGVGKELVASSIHKFSKRAGKPYVCVNMAAIPASLAASELFGHVQGAFTGATRNRNGYFFEANGGTLFLDELGDTPEETQPLLLRAIENKAVQPIGGTIKEIDVRLIAATDSNLEQAIEGGRFRRPLLERIAGYNIQIPPLRERRDDIGRLFIHFFRKELELTGELFRLQEISPGKSWVPANLVAKLVQYDWPGNVRQLQNVTRQLAISNRDSEVFRVEPAVAKLLKKDDNEQPSSDIQEVPTKPYRRRPADLSDNEILRALEANDYNINTTSTALEVSRSWLILHLKHIDCYREAKDIGANEIKRCAANHNNDVAEMAKHLRISVKALQMRMKSLRLS